MRETNQKIRMIAAALAFLMTVSVFPMQAFAVDGSNQFTATVCECQAIESAEAYRSTWQERIDEVQLALDQVKTELPEKQTALEEANAKLASAKEELDAAIANATPAAQPVETEPVETESVETESAETEQAETEAETSTPDVTEDATVIAAQAAYNDALAAQQTAQREYNSVQSQVDGYQTTIDNYTKQRDVYGADGLPSSHELRVEATSTHDGRVQVRCDLCDGYRSDEVLHFYDFEGNCVNCAHIHTAGAEDEHAQPTVHDAFEDKTMGLGIFAWTTDPLNERKAYTYLAKYYNNNATSGDSLRFALSVDQLSEENQNALLTYYTETLTPKFTLATTTLGNTAEPNEAVATIGDTPYATLKEAVEAAENDNTVARSEDGTVVITLQQDTTGTGIIVHEGSKITFDLAGHTYNITEGLVGSAGTQTNGFQLLAGSTVTFSNGTITSDCAKILIQNYSNLSLWNTTLEVSEENENNLYILSNNFGKANVQVSCDGTSVIDVEW